MGLRFSKNTRDFTQLSDSNLVREEDPSDEIQKRRRRTGSNKRVALEQKVKPSLAKPDGASIYTRLGGEEILSFI
ncbi:hypothetical protein GGS23DRAFT_584238 [Durotheca rogersii]|uniref:uncharacterized protein n=1 Tax=Durotheca rogersii TaxID=419775 RepID=UPI0022211707|nr:uncharacterized protein GGS23DRAFT_584238 [Durotheca rogersii]KAI5859743.1 hypothetical protein GGS23DRAFT_584238 [Durotheca rogersii]